MPISQLIVLKPDQEIKGLDSSKGGGRKEGVQFDGESCWCPSEQRMGKF